MKLKNSESNPKDPFQIRIRSNRGFHATRSSDSRFPITTDTSRKRKVEFTDPVGENKRPPRCDFADNAKTSEYAFFKKLKEGASNNSHSCSLREEAYQTKNSKSRDCPRERIDMVQNKREDTRSSFLNKNATPELNMKRACATLEDIHGKQHDMVDEYESALRTKGQRLTHFEEMETENRHADVFGRKRQKLRQWVTETSFPEIDELCSKGYDFVSVLLSRLVPKCNESNKFKHPKLMQADTNDKSMPLPSYESDIHFRKLQWTPARDFMELECGPCWHDCIPSCLSKRSRERIYCSNSPTSYAYKNRQQYRVWEPGSELLGGSEISYAESNSLSVLPFEEYGSVTCGHDKEMDIFYQPNEYLVERELHVPMLDWDFGSTNEDRNLSTLSRYRAEHRSASLASYDNHKVLRHCLEGNHNIRSGFHHIPLTLSCMPNFISLAEDCFNDTACEVGSSTIFSLQNDHWFRSEVISEGHYPPTTEYLLSSGLDSNIGWKHPPFPFSGSWREHCSSVFHALEFPGQEDISSHHLTYDDDKHERSLDEYSSHTRSLSHFIEDKVSIPGSSVFCPRTSLDREKAWPLLLDKSSWDGSSEGEMNFDDQ